MAHLEDSFEVREPHGSRAIYEVIDMATGLRVGHFKSAKQAYDVAGDLLSKMDRMDLSKPRFVYERLNNEYGDGWAVSDRLTGQLVTGMMSTKHSARNIAVSHNDKWDAWLLSCGVPVGGYGSESDELLTDEEKQPEVWGSW